MRGVDGAGEGAGAVGGVVDGGWASKRGSAGVVGGIVDGGGNAGVKVVVGGIGGPGSGLWGCW